MKTGKITIALIGMVVLGGLGFWALAALVEYRIGRPVAATEHLSETGRNEPMKILQQGIRDSVDSAIAALERQDQSSAAAALDASKRAAEVARDAGVPEFGRVFKAIQQARLAIQNGNRQHAQEILSSMRPSLSDSIPNNSTPPLATETKSFMGYRGATVLNAQGVRIGEVENLEGERANLAIGGKRDLLGFIDFSGGKSIAVPLDQLALGKRKNLGSTMVVLPTFDVSSEHMQFGVVAARHTGP